VQRVFQNLLRERASIRDAGSILEAIAEAAPSTRNPILLTEYVRQAIRRSIVKPFVNKAGELPAWFLDPATERGFETTIQHGEQTSQIGASPETIAALAKRVEATAAKPEAPVVMIVGSTSRYFIRQIVESKAPNLFVLSHGEIPPEVNVISLGVI